MNEAIHSLRRWTHHITGDRLNRLAAAIDLRSVAAFNVLPVKRATRRSTATGSIRTGRASTGRAARRKVNGIELAGTRRLRRVTRLDLDRLPLHSARGVSPGVQEGRAVFETRRIIIEKLIMTKAGRVVVTR